MFTNYLDLNLGWQGWRRSLTEADQEVTWTTPRIINGWKLYSTSSLPVRFSKNALGEVEINGAVRDGPLGKFLFLFYQKATVQSNLFITLEWPLASELLEHRNIIGH